MYCLSVSAAPLNLFCFQNTYTNASQIKEAIKQLQDSGECRPDEIRKRTQYFDRRVQNFIRRVEERKQILEQAVSFYSSTKTVSCLLVL